MDLSSCVVDELPRSLVPRCKGCGNVWPSCFRDESQSSRPAEWRRSEVIACRCLRAPATQRSGEMAPLLRASTLAALVAIAGRGVAAQAEHKEMVSFAPMKKLNTEFREQNDPVMGGGSSGNFTVGDGFGLFQGTVRNVSFLHAPGFCNAQVRTGARSRLDVSEFATEQGGLRLVVKNAREEYAPYEGHKIAFSALGVPHHNGGHELEGSYKADFKLSSASEGKCAVIYVPFAEFSSGASRLRLMPPTAAAAMSCLSSVYRAASRCRLAQLA